MQSQSPYPSPDSGCSPQVPRRRRHEQQAPGRGHQPQRGWIIILTTTPTAITSTPIQNTPTPNRSPRRYHTSRHQTLNRKWMFHFLTPIPSSLQSSTSRLRSSLPFHSPQKASQFSGSRRLKSERNGESAGDDRGSKIPGSRSRNGATLDVSTTKTLGTVACSPVFGVFHGSAPPPCCRGIPQ